MHIPSVQRHLFTDKNQSMSIYEREAKNDDNQTFCSNIGWHPLKSHDGTCTSFLGNTSLR